ncbi:hypothetical protein EON66_08640 [archaeon]|nr:MAG: hypothetical protein EON66_08640 [archaeon]
MCACVSFKKPLRGASANTCNADPAPWLPTATSVDAASAAATIADERVSTQFMVQDARAVLPFEGGETAALARMHAYFFSAEQLPGTYKLRRNGMLGADYSTKLSPWLASGALSARSVTAQVRAFEARCGANESTYWILFELLWRDFFRFATVGWGTRLFHARGPLGGTSSSKKTAADVAAWLTDRSQFSAWAAGRTGYPFVDANMRELLATGFMSNRGRQNVASFFVRDLGMHWHLGAQWFEGLLLGVCNCVHWHLGVQLRALPTAARALLHTSAQSSTLQTATCIVTTVTGRTWRAWALTRAKTATFSFPSRRAITMRRASTCAHGCPSCAMHRLTNCKILVD